MSLNRYRRSRRECAATLLGLFLLAHGVPGVAKARMRYLSVEQWQQSQSQTGEAPRGADHRIVKRINANGEVFHWSYHYPDGSQAARGKSMFIEPDYYQTLMQYPATNRTTVTYRRGNLDQTTDYYYDRRISSVTNIVGPNTTDWVETRRYGPSLDMTNQVMIDHSTGKYTDLRLSFSTNHLPLSAAYGYSCAPTSTWQLTWHEDYGTPTSLTDPEGNQIEAEYTNALLSELKLVVSSNQSHVASFGYTTNGLLSAVTNANGHYVRFTYDSKGYATNIVPEAGPTVTLLRDELGYIDKILLPGPSGTRTNDLEFNELGQLTSATYASGLSESFTHDAYGNILTHVDTAGRTNTYTYVLTGRFQGIKRVLEGATPQEVEIGLDYDQQLNLVEITDPLDREVETYELDAADRVTKVTNLETQQLSVSYAVGDYVDSVTRFDGTTVDLEYDGNGRLSLVDYPSVSNAYVYLANGLLKTAQNEQGTITNQYNTVNRLTSSAGTSPSGTVSYAYYPAGQVSNLTGVAGSITYSNDAAERVSRITSPEDTFDYTYNSNNGLVSCVSNSSVRAGYAYDVVDRLAKVEYLDSTNGVVFSATNWYDNAGMITQRQTVAGGTLFTEVYGYDSLYRLTSDKRLDATNGTVYSNSYQYDLAGNRTNATVEGTSEAYALGTGNRLSSWGTNSTVSYDTAGNATNIDYSASRELDLEWNDRYQLTSVATNGSVAETYAYDPLGRRAWYSDGSTTNHLVYDGIHVLAEVDGDGDLLKSYTWGPGIDNLLAFTDYTGGSTSTYWCLTDHLGTVHALANSSGAIAESYRYDAWGRVVGVYNGSGTSIGVSAVGNRYLWQGRWYSWETGLYYFRARWYDPATGRWLSKDPIGISGGLNQYVFCGNNPVNFRDPLGLLEEDFYESYEVGYDAVAYDFWNLFVGSLFGRDTFLSSIDVDIGLGQEGVGAPGNIAAGDAFMRHYGPFYGALAALLAELATNQGDTLTAKLRNAMASFYYNGVGAAREARQNPGRAAATVMLAGWPEALFVRWGVERLGAVPCR